MKITIVTLFPNMIKGFVEESILKRAQEKGVLQIEIINLRDFAVDAYGSVDDKPYGGGTGMVTRIEPVAQALQKTGVKKADMTSRIALTSPRGKKFGQAMARSYAQLQHLVLIAGHYEGFDERISEYVDEEVSLGDFVLTGGEIPAAAICDAVARLLPGTLKKDDATEKESFFEVAVDELIAVCGDDEVLESIKGRGVEKVALLEYPQYTRPEEFEGKRVPDVLLSGHHADIEKWRLKMAYETTKRKRIDLLYRWFGR